MRLGAERQPRKVVVRMVRCGLNYDEQKPVSSNNSFFFVPLTSLSLDIAGENIAFKLIIKLREKKRR